MNYFVTAAALKVASANSLTRSTYRALTRLKSGPRVPQIDRGVWLLPALPTHAARLLELGTGWVHAYSLYPALLRSDELHCFDTSDNRHFKSFKATVPIVRSQIHDREAISAKPIEFSEWPTSVAQAASPTTPPTIST